jgi:tetratricopeptide (TPR) repeat protein
MKPFQYIRIAFSSACLVSLFIFNGCSIFGPVGHAVSQGYENTVSYFNGYYNAKWLFSEAEDEIHSDALLRRGQASSPATANQIPATAKDKLTKVIDKCSNILAFHSSSTLVDDALILIGKSFYYQAEYLKAERKFAELLAQFPNSSLVLETQIWYARTEEKLGKVDDGIRICESTIAAAKRSGDDEIEVQAHLLLGRFYLMSKETEKTITEYAIAVKLSTDEEVKTDIQLRLGDIYFSGGQYEEAAEAYLQVGKYTSDVYSNYYSKLQAAIAFRNIKEYKKGLALLDAMIDNFRNKSYLPELLYERANNYAESGKRDDAISEYTYVDTIFAPREHSIRSAYQLGKIYENELGNYQLALKYYTKVNSSTGIQSLDSGRLKYAAFTRYYDAWKELGKADSLLFALREAKRKAQSDSLSEVLSDTTRHIDTLRYSPSMLLMPDSLAFKADSLALNLENPPSRSMEAPVDSLKILRSLSDSLQREISRMVTQYSKSRADSLVHLKAMKDFVKRRIMQFASHQSLPSRDSLKSKTDSTQQLYKKDQPQSHRSSVDSLATVKSLSDLKQNNNTQSPLQRSQNKRDSLRRGALIVDSMQNRILQTVSQLMLSNVDSLNFKTDSVQIKTGSSAYHDTLSIRDSLGSPSSSIRKKKIKVSSKPAGISADSLNVLKSIAAQELGDIFYTEIIVPDSAFYWYDHAITWNYSSTRSPRILYILAELSRENPRKDYSTPEEYYMRLERDFSESVYAEEARRILGKTDFSKKTDTAAVYYQQAEKQVDAKQYKQAIKTYRTIAQTYPQSLFAAKSDYAIGWVLENHLAMPESAFVQYKYVVKNYKGTLAAVIAGNQIVAALQIEKEKLDSLKLIATKLDSAKTFAAKADSVKKIALHLDSLKNSASGIDTSKTKGIAKDTSQMKQVRADSSKLKQTKFDSIKNKSAPMDTLKSKEVKKDSLKTNSGTGIQEKRTPEDARNDSAKVGKRMLDNR